MELFLACKYSMGNKSCFYILIKPLPIEFLQL